MPFISVAFLLLTGDPCRVEAVYNFRDMAIIGFLLTQNDQAKSCLAHVKDLDIHQVRIETHGPDERFAPALGGEWMMTPSGVDDRLNVSVGRIFQ